MATTREGESEVRESKNEMILHASINRIHRRNAGEKLTGMNGRLHPSHLLNWLGKKDVLDFSFYPSNFDKESNLDAGTC
jgi:hypothetical protein